MTNKKQLYQDIILSLGMIIMFSYGIWVGNIIGNYGYISVLITGITIFIFLIFNYKFVLLGINKQ